MNLFEMILLNSTFVIFPLLCYLLYLVFEKTLDKNKSSLYLDFAFFTAFYLLIKFGITTYKDIPLIIFDIPLVIAYIKNRKFSIIVLSLIIILYYYDKFEISGIFIILEYLSYYILCWILKCKKKNERIFLNVYVLLKIVFFYTYIYLSPIYDINTLTKSFDFIILMLVFYIMTYLVVILFNKSNSIVSLYNSIQNIEEDKRIKESLFKITHEIKNPIAVCKGYLDMFDANNKKHARNYIPIIKSEIERVLVLLEDFLYTTRIKIDKDIMDISLLLEDISDSFSMILKNKNIKFSYQYIEELYICADYDRLKQVLVNVIKNSTEAINCDGHIKMYTKLLERSVKIFVEDNGIGMDDNELERIKEAFFTTKKTGTGLGIYLSNEIIKLHKGSIVYKSKKGVGTTVIITVPINKKDIKIIS